jgi:alpha-1,2-mannosyltransferase
MGTDRSGRVGRNRVHFPGGRSFIAALPDAEAWNANGVPGFDKFVSPYAAARLLGASKGVGWAIQAAMAVVAIAVLVLVARRRPGCSAEIAVLVVAMGFCVPFLGEYELVIFVVPATWLASEAIRTRWLPYERVALAFLYLSPLVIKSAAVHRVPLGPVVLAGLAALVLRRVSRRAGLLVEQPLSTG